MEGQWPYTHPLLTLPVIGVCTFTTINLAIDTGGAIYITRNEHYEPYFTLKYLYHCFHQLLDYNEDSWYDIQFQNNSAKNGGDPHIWRVHAQ